MVKSKYLLFIIINFCLFLTTASAATCSYEERAQLNSEVSNIQASYEVVEGELPEDMCYPLDGFEDEEYSCPTEFMQINILNISENMVVEVSDDVYNTNRIFTYTDTDSGNLTIFLVDQDGNQISLNPSVVDYTIEIYASDATGCEDTLLRTINLRLPRYNTYANSGYCVDLPDYYLCQDYVTFDEVDYDIFYKNITNEIQDPEETIPEEEEKSWYENAWDFVVEHKLAFIIGGIVIVVGVSGIVAYVIIKRRREEL